MFFLYDIIIANISHLTKENENRNLTKVSFSNTPVEKKCPVKIGRKG